MKRRFTALFIILSLCLLGFSTLAEDVKIKSWQTKKGTRVIFYPSRDLPILDIQMAFAAGSAYDGAFFGLSALTTQLLNQGSKTLDASDIALRFADVGAQFNADSNRDMAVLQLKTLTRRDALTHAVDTLALVVGEPAFKEEAFLRSLKSQQSSLEQAEESPVIMANWAFFQNLYQDHPYAHPIQGTPESLKKMKLQDVETFYRRYFVSSNAIIVMVGAIDEAKAKEIAETLTAKLAVGSPAPSVRKAPLWGDKKTIELQFPSKQTVFRLGQVAISHDSPDFFPLMVGNYILGGGTLVSRLAIELREKEGLTYGIDSQLLPLPGNGPFLIGFSTKNSQAKKALDLTYRVLNEFLTQGPTDEELAAAKAYLIGSFPLSLASNSHIASALLRQAFYHLPEDYLQVYTKKIAAVNVTEIRQAFSRLIHPETFLLIEVGPKK